MTRSGDPAAAVAWLSTPAAIRERAGQVHAAARRGETRHFALDEAKLPAAADYVVEVIRAEYPTLDIPYHSRWRHFDVGGVERWAVLAARQHDVDPLERARLRVDLAVVSVLLDAGAGPDWSYREAATGRSFARSEGLAVASFDMFVAGAFAADSGQPWRADGAALAGFTPEALKAGFQVTPGNPLVGLEGRAELLRRLGGALAAQPALFGAAAPRVGNLVDHLVGQARDRRLPAGEILAALLAGLRPIWPARVVLGGVALGDVGRHPAARGDALTAGLVPFHKLSQWLAYSLVEPLEDAGIEVTDLDGLTGLPEYRNGGLFIDLGVLVPRSAELATRPLAADSEPIVEWRALTVILLDRIADEVRRRLGLTAAQMPLAKVLQGGTWTAGRKIARARRPDGRPPIAVLSDGTIF